MKTSSSEKQFESMFEHWLFLCVFQPCGIPTLPKGDKQMLGRNDELMKDKKLKCIELKGDRLWQEKQ